MIQSKNSWKLYWPFAKSEIQRALAYKLSFFTSLLVDFLQIAIAYYLWKAIFDSSTNSTMNGFSRDEMMIYIIMSFLTSMVIQSGADWIVSSEVREGEVAINLIRPISYIKRLAAMGIGNIIWQFIGVFLPALVFMIAYRYFALGLLPPSILSILLYFISLAMSFIVLFLFNFCFGLAAFFVTYIWGLNMCKDAILRFVSGAMIPVAFFPLWLQNLVTYLPFGALNYTPVMIYLNKFDSSEMVKVLGIQALWIIILYFFSGWVWNKAVKKLVIMGG